MKYRRPVLMEVGIALLGIPFIIGSLIADYKKQVFLFLLLVTALIGVGIVAGWYVPTAIVAIMLLVVWPKQVIKCVFYALVIGVLIVVVGGIFLFLLSTEQL